MITIVYMLIYVDHFFEQEEIAGTLVSRIRAISPDVVVTSYKEEREKKANKKIRKDLSEAITIDMLSKADICIPIVTSDYLVFGSDGLEKAMASFTTNPDKYIFPLIYSPSNWSSKSWIVKSKVYPFGGVPFIDLADASKEVELNSLVQTISDIVNKKHDTSVSQLPEVKTIGNKGKIVFISHDHDDADFAELLKLRLEEKGVVGWIDSERLRIGQDWRQEIDDGISMAIAVIAIMTPHARKSEYVTYEWAYAWGKGKKIFPIMLKQTPLHPRLESLQYLDFTNRVTRPWDRLIDSILELTGKIATVKGDNLN